MDALVVLGAWAGGSVVASLATGTLIARADRVSQRRSDAARPARPAPVPTTVLSLLPRPRAAGSPAADGAGQQLTHPL